MPKIVKYNLPGLDQDDKCFTAKVNVSILLSWGFEDIISGSSEPIWLVAQVEALLVGTYW